MPFYAAQMTLSMTSNVTADEVVNTLYFSGSTPSTDAGVIETLMEGLYDDLNSVYSVDVRQNNHVLKIFNLDDTKPRVPILETLYSFPAAPSTSSLPHEVALCLSFQAARQSGIPQARRRGRIYVGPLRTAAVAAGGEVQASVVTQLATIGDDFLTATAASAVVWGVYSTVDQDLYAVANGWVDNAFDTQRRRGTTATARTVFP